MKQGSFNALKFAVCLILIAGIAVSTAFGQDKTVDFVSVMLEDFSHGTHHEWTVGNRTFAYNYSWKLDASKFATETAEEGAFPKLTYVDSYPQAVYGYNRGGLNIQSLGIWGKFDRRGYNWVDLYPVSGDDEEPFEIPLPGRVSYFDSWIWGSNLNYYIEIYVRDYQGIVHNIYLGSLAFQGWMNLRVRIPANIPQTKRVLPVLAGLHFVKFRIWTTPLERVDNFYIYIDHFKILTDAFEEMFDGDELTDPDRIRELWADAR